MSNKLATVTQWLDDSRPSFEEMNLNALDFNKEKEFMIQAFQNNPYLLGMEPNSVRNILVNCALTGITLNPIMKYGYPVPRKGKLCLDVSYIGMVKILTDTGSVKSIKAGMVYSNEPFDIELGSGGFVKHKPYFGQGGKGEPLGCYSLATLNDGSFHVHWMYQADIVSIMNRSESVKSGKQSPWLSDPEQMSIKTAIKQHFKYLPKSERAEMAANAIDIDHQNNGIDFEKEQKPKAKAANVVSLDTLDPESEEDIAGWNKIKALFESDVLPETLNDGSIDVLAKAEELTGEFMEGTLTKELANKWYQYIKAQVDHFTANPIPKEDPQEGEPTESETNDDF